MLYILYYGLNGFAGCYTIPMTVDFIIFMVLNPAQVEEREYEQDLQILKNVTIF